MMMGPGHSYDDGFTCSFIIQWMHMHINMYINDDDDDMHL